MPTDVCKLTVRLTVPTEPAATLHDRPILFTRWFPRNEEDEIVVRRNDTTVRVWFDEECLLPPYRVDPDELRKFVDVRADRVNVDVIVPNVGRELCQFIYEERDRPKKGWDTTPETERYERLKGAYTELGDRVLTEAVAVYNRLISYCRNQKGQYWLEERPLTLLQMSSRFTEFRAKVRSEDYGWVRWRPPHTDVLVSGRVDRPRLVAEEDWPAAKEFVRSEKRPELVLELLANADRLAQEGYSRSAIIEAVAALEVALSDYAKQNDLSDVLPTATVERIERKSLANLVDDLGLRKSLGFLVPLIVSEDELPTDVLEECRRAVDIRNTVVHQGQREVRDPDLESALKAIRTACAGLKT